MRSAPFRSGALLWRASFWLCFAFSSVMALLPKPPRVPLDRFGDKFEHMAAFAVLAAIALLAFPGMSRVRLALGLSAFGAGIELAQAIPALHRDSDVRDWLVDTAAVVLVLGLALLLRRLRAQSGSR